MCFTQLNMRTIKKNITLKSIPFFGVERMPNCPYCGGYVADGTNFCPNCGQASIVQPGPPHTYTTYAPPPGAPPGYGYYPPVYYPDKQLGDILGIIGLVFGIIGIFIFNIIFGPIAIVFGAIAIAKHSPAFGVAALVLGIVDIVLFFVLLMWIVSLM